MTALSPPVDVDPETSDAVPPHASGIAAEAPTRAAATEGPGGARYAARTSRPTVRVRRTVDADWRDRAACLGFPTNLFFPTLGENATRAKAICATCPVSAECLAWALSEDPAPGAGRHPHGVFGGKSPREREAILRQRKGWR